MIPPAETTSITECESLLKSRHLPEAIRCFQDAEAGGAESGRCASGRWTAFMLSGQFEAAWLESDALRRRGTPDPHRFWQGESLAGKRVMLRCLHGFGDATQFLRYAPRLRALASSLTVEVSPRFAHLAGYFDGVDRVIEWGPLAPTEPVPWDVQVEIMELPYLFRTQLAELPIAEKYLRPPTPPPLRSIQSGHMRVGLAWTSGTWNPSRSITLEALNPLFDTPGCEFWSLEGGPESAEERRPFAFPLHEDPSCRDSIEGLAATISQLDLVITVDSLAAHLAGALGVRAWVLLQHAADWRWLHDRCDSPWYPSVRLFRQAVPGDWDGVVRSVAQALQTESTTREPQNRAPQP